VGSLAGGDSVGAGGTGVNEADVLEFSRRDGRWSIESQAGRLRLSNDLECNRRRTEMERVSFEFSEARQPIPVLWEARPRLGQKISGWEAEVVGKREQEIARAQAALDEARSRAALLPVEHSLRFGAVAAATMLLPTAFLLRLIATPAVRRHRRGRGFCAQCGYDLRATPERCPECGSVPVNGKVAR
jgi:hypothetical protein